MCTFSSQLGEWAKALNLKTHFHTFKCWQTKQKKDEYITLLKNMENDKHRQVKVHTS